ncbi:hypothetical protein AB0M11_10220 [Streptomyces sp. NPDC051987]|uniref:hypothetical protein n=1 Tax=Streptomyces sp. NPDC051987 TaxID=3155808 RepID=UPI003449A405
MSATYVRTNAGTGAVTATCDAGDFATGGGFVAAGNAAASESFPGGGTPPTQWTATATTGQTIVSFVVCADATP